MKPAYLFNPELKFLREGYQGNVLQKGRFVNEDKDFGAGFSKVLQWMFSKNPHREEKKNSTYRIVPEPDRSIFGKGDDAFVWLGHAAFLFRINNKLILTDPCLYDLPGIKRQFASPFRTSELKNIDYILLSHSHRDHFDTRSMREIVRANPDVQIFCPLKMEPLVKRIGGRRITEAGWYQEFPGDKTGIRFAFLPAKHWNRRYVHDTNRELWGAFWIGTTQQSIYFAGDTAYHSHFADAQKILPPLKHAFLPIGAYKPNFMMKSSHTSPQEALQGFKDLQAQVFVPMHYGTYDLSDEPLSEPMEILNASPEADKLIAPSVIPGRIYSF
jgi:L-ascorbate metabolism protein UlaG (beta-lactamase superfamily)